MGASFSWKENKMGSIVIGVCVFIAIILMGVGVEYKAWKRDMKIASNYKKLYDDWLSTATVINPKIFKHLTHKVVK